MLEKEQNSNLNSIELRHQTLGVQNPSHEVIPFVLPSIITTLADKHSTIPLIQAAIMELQTPDEMRSFLREYVTLDVEMGSIRKIAEKRIIQNILVCASKINEKVASNWENVINNPEISIFTK